jgi:hypothetical protein
MFSGLHSIASVQRKTQMRYNKLGKAVCGQLRLRYIPSPSVTEGDPIDFKLWSEKKSKQENITFSHHCDGFLRSITKSNIFIFKHCSSSQEPNAALYTIVQCHYLLSHQKGVAVCLPSLRRSCVLKLSSALQIWRRMKKGSSFFGS